MKGERWALLQRSAFQGTSNRPRKAGVMECWSSEYWSSPPVAAKDPGHLEHQETSLAAFLKLVGPIQGSFGLTPAKVLLSYKFGVWETCRTASRKIRPRQRHRLWENQHLVDVQQVQLALWRMDEQFDWMGFPFRVVFFPLTRHRAVPLCLGSKF